MANEVVKSEGGLKGYLTANKQTISEACAYGTTADRLIKTACLLATSKNGAALSKCSPQSVLRAVVDCARFGIDPAFGRAYLIPYGNEAELQLGYLGLIELSKRSGEIKSIVSELVQEEDEFDVEVGTNPKFSHRPKFKSDGNNFKFVYALAVFKDEHFEYTVLSKEDVENIRTKYSKAPNSPAWQKSYGEMAKKCAIRRLCKTLPLTIEAQEAIEQDDRRNNVIDVDVSMPSAKSTAAAKLDAMLGIEKKPEPETVIEVEPENTDWGDNMPDFPDE
jgi:recombination protein RecT